MLRRTIKYTDYDGNEVEEEFLFNLTKAEILSMEISTSGGIEQHFNDIAKKRDGEKIMKEFRELILNSYGEKSLDGKRFIKSKELSEAFAQTEAYSELFVELVTDADKAADFFNAVIPPELAQKAAETKAANALPNVEEKVVNIK